MQSRYYSMVYIYMEKERIEFYFIIPENYQSLLKEKISDIWKGVTVQDLLNLKRYHSLNLLSYEKGYWAGITALPKPLYKS